MKVIAFAAASLLLSAGVAGAEPSASGQVLSFAIVVPQFDYRGDWDIGGGICLGSKRVTDPKDYGDIQWSPDGRRFVFYRQTGMGTADVFVAEADGSNERNLTAEAGGFDWSPSWSPDGSRIVYSAGGIDPMRLVTMRPDGSDKRPLPATAAVYAAHPDWSPNGSEIAYTRGDSSSVWSVHIIDANGRDRRVVEKASDPQWSPDGRRLAFVRGADLVLANADGSDERLVTRTIDLEEGEPEWSPDGTTIAFVRADMRDPRVAEPPDQGGLFLVDADGRRVRRIRGPAGAAGVTWRPSTEPVRGARSCWITPGRPGRALRGTSRGDLIAGGRRNDFILAGGGDDLIFAGRGVDRILAGPGADVIGAQDNKRDLVDGGPGADRARVDRRRDRIRSVERLLR